MWGKVLCQQSGERKLSSLCLKIMTNSLTLAFGILVLKLNSLVRGKDYRHANKAIKKYKVDHVLRINIKTYHSM